MLKGVKKGIKKKIKGKKDKKEDDLFDPDQLEKYKRELEEAKKARQQDEEAAGASGGHEEDEEWQRFKAMTSGVDALVNKGREDLDRIKESSFFQRNKPSEQNRLFASERPAKVPPPKQPPAESDQGGGVDGEGHEVPEGNEEGATSEDAADGATGQIPESPEIEPVELDDSLFDTSFLDAVATGEIKLAYIPDSPTHEEEGDDPFDTSGVADVCKRIEEEEKRQKRQVNLGLAVDVLTGKADPTVRDRPRVKAAENKPKARPRPHAVNLLGDFDDAHPPSMPIDSKQAVSDKGKSVFDAILDSPSKDESTPLEKVDLLPGKAEGNASTKSDKEEDGKDLKNVIDEFDIIGQLDPISGNADPEPLNSGVPTSIPSSIAALLSTAPAQPEEDELDDEFAALAAESIHKAPPPSALPQDEPAAEEEEEDPFDTSYVEKTAVHGKCELKILEDEFVGEIKSETDKPAAAGEDDDDFDFNPRLGESPPKTLLIQNAPKNNPLEDLSPCAVKAPAIQPQVTASGPSLGDTEEGKCDDGGESNEDVDPFDTSKLETVLPGKAELKLLEHELLSSVEQPVMEPPKLPETIATAIIKSQQTVDDEDFDFDPRKDEVKHHPLDMPDISNPNAEPASVLMPLQEDEIELDPFDTSAVSASGLIPGPLELKLLENELVSPTVEVAPAIPVATEQQSARMTRTISDEDFDPRCGQPPPPSALQPQLTTEDIFDSAMDFAVDKPLTPQLEMAPTAMPEPALCPTNSDDPFDTSGIQIENYLAKSELKQVEEELLNTPHQPLPQTRTSPVIVAVELKKPPPPQPQPVLPEPPPDPHPLEALTPLDDFKPLTPVEVPTMSGVISVFNPSPMADPFDTSIAEGVIPGKTEIKLLEEELGVAAGMPRSLSDDDFNPRASVHPSQFVTHTLTPAPAQSSAPVQQGGNGADPFDTSGTSSNNNNPGKAELKALEAELL